MSITKFIKKICVQTAVYWGNPVNDGYGGKVYDEPREIKCRWEDKIRDIRLDGGRELVAKAEILVTEDLSYEGWVCLATLQQLEDPDNDYKVPSNPKEVNGAYLIVAFDKIPLIKSTSEFVQKVTLGYGNLS